MSDSDSPLLPHGRELRGHYNELAKRNEDLRRVQAELAASRARYFDLYDLAPVGYVTLSEQGLVLEANLTAATLLGRSRGELDKQLLTRFILQDDQQVYALHCQKLFETGASQTCELRLVKPDGGICWTRLETAAAKGPNGAPAYRVVLSDISERKQAEASLKQIEWMFSSEATPNLCRTEDHDQGYGDLTELNRDGMILTSIGHERLKSLVSDYLELLGTSSAIYEVNGDYAFGIFASGWCRMMDLASRKLCNTSSNAEALNSGRWLCHESCWKSCSWQAMASGSPVDIECHGGIRLYAVPIIADGKVVGAINFGYGDPPKDPEKLRKLSAAYQLHYDALVREVEAYNSRPPYMIEMAKRRLQATAQLIGSIVETKQIEAALRESEEKYRVLFNSFPLGITISDPSGKILESNARAAELLGISQGEHESRRIDGDQWRIIRPDGTPMPVEEYASVVALKENCLVENVELGVVKPDAEVTWLNVTAAPLLLEKYGVVITYNDVTERKRAEEALRNREFLLNKVFDVLPIGLWFADEKGRLIRGNPAGVKIWGAEPTVPIEEYGVFQARRLPSREEIAPDDWALAHTIREGVTIEAELLEIDAFDGHKKIILNYTAPVLDDQGELQGAIVVNHDITEREHLHAQLQQALKMESVGRLAGGVAHDFNNMLAVILGYTEIAMDQMNTARPLLASLQEIRKAAERSADLTRQLLTFARKQTIAPKVIDLNETVDGMLKMLRRLIGEDIDLVWKPGRNLGAVKVDPSQIHQLLANLCVNARDAISSVGKITIETDAAAFDEAWCAAHTGVVPGEYVLLAVSDNGCGMDQETLDHLFEPFFTTKGVGKGTGLGLATVYGMVQQNNGFVDVSSEPGQGTTFKIYLPRHAAKTAPSPENTPDRSAERGDETILLVEDEPAILKMATTMLERLGYAVIGARAPGEAIRLAETHAGPIHLLVTDVVMPEMNGRDLAEHILSLQPNLKCLFMSGYMADVIAHQGVLAAGVQFIQKPFSMTDFAAKLRQALGDEPRKD